MFDFNINQGVGLQHIGRAAIPSVIAMASHGNQQGELPLLWGLCSTLVDLGYSVAVLDAQTSESTDNPGLLQMLDGSHSLNECVTQFDSWSVIPAACGMSRMGARKTGSLAPLSGVLGNYGVIVLYACAETFVDLLSGTGIEPLLTVSPHKVSSFTAYKSLKKMLLDAGLTPTVAHLAMNSNSKSEKAAHSTVQKLQECSLAFLGYRVDAFNIRVWDAEEKVADDLHRLTLRLLENAMPLPRYQFGGSL